MASRDPAFQWETEMLRSSRPSRSSQPFAAGRDNDDANDWLTLKEAAETTGVPSSTIRKWARQEKIPSFLERTEDGFVRVVSMRGITRWTEQIGREIKAPEMSSTEKTDESNPSTAGVSGTSSNTVPEGTMIVPLDAWNRMLNQLGNLHEAGQQLAEAKERAAKAETESRFLRERLTELRVQLDEASHTAPNPHSDAETGASQGTQTPPGSLARSIYRSWRAGRRSRR